MLLYHSNPKCHQGYGIDGQCWHVLSDKVDMEEANKELLEYMDAIDLPRDAKELHHPKENREHLDLEPEQFLKEGTEDTPKVTEGVLLVTEREWKVAQACKRPYYFTEKIMSPQIKGI